MLRLILAALIFVLFPLCAQAKTLEQLLAEKGVITKAESGSVTSGAPVRAFWNDGTRIEFPDAGFAVKVAAFLQTRYSYTDAPEEERDVSGFDVQNARIEINGTVLNEQFEYELEYDGESDRMKKVYLQWNPCEFSYIRLGQFKTAVSRQFAGTDWKLMFADRSLVSEYFSWGYQKGLRAQSRFLDDQVTAGFNVTNGNSDGEGEYASATDTRHLITGDLRWNVMGRMDPFEEGDVDSTQAPSLNFGAVYGHSDSRNEIAGMMDRLSVDRFNFDGNFKFRGLGLNAEYYVSDERPGIGDRWTAQGAYFQGGYFVMPERLEVALRWGMVDCDNGRGSGLCTGMDDLDQATAGINYYFWKHNLKAQLNYDYLRMKTIDGDGMNSNRWLFQLSSYF